MKFNFSHKIAVITGGGGGIGKQMLEEFKQAGAKVAVIDLNPQPVDCFGRELSWAGQSKLHFSGLD